MGIKRSLILGITAVLIFISTGFAFSQDQSEQVEVSQPLDESNMQWVWGEVVSVDKTKKTLKVKYLDYETDQEQELRIGIDDRTTYENVNSLEEIKPKDTAGIDYAVGPEGNNIARNVSIENADTFQIEEDKDAEAALTGEPAPEPEKTEETQAEEKPAEKNPAAAAKTKSY